MIDELRVELLERDDLAIVRSFKNLPRSSRSDLCFDGYLVERDDDKFGRRWRSRRIGVTEGGPARAKHAGHAGIFRHYDFDFGFDPPHALGDLQAFLSVSPVFQPSRDRRLTFVF